MNIIPKTIQYIKVNYGYITFVILGILSIPFSLYIFNVKEFGYDYFLLITPVFLSLTFFLIGYIVSIVVKLATKSFSNFNKNIQNVFSALGLIIFINDFFVPTRAGALKGIEKAIAEPAILTVMETVITLIITIILILSFNSKKITKVLVSISHYSLMLLLFFCLTTFYLNIFDNNQVEHEDYETTPPKNEVLANQSPNIYFIWLDGMQNDFLLKGLNEYNLFENFPGFTLFPNPDIEFKLSTRL